MKPAKRQRRRGRVSQRFLRIQAELRNVEALARIGGRPIGAVHRSVLGPDGKLYVRSTAMDPNAPLGAPCPCRQCEERRSDAARG